MATIKPINYPLTEPEWEQQEGETPKEYHIFLLFCAYGGFLHDFFKALQGHSKGTEFCGIIIKYKLPESYSTYKHLSSARYWFERRDKKENYEQAFLVKQFTVIDMKRAVERYELKEDIEYESLVWLRGRVKGRDPKLTGGQFKDTTQGIRNIQDSKNIDSGKDVQKMEHKLEAEVDAKAEVKTDLEKDIEKYDDLLSSGDLTEITKNLLEDME